MFSFPSFEVVRAKCVSLGDPCLTFFHKGGRVCGTQMDFFPLQSVLMGCDSMKSMA